MPRTIKFTVADGFKPKLVDGSIQLRSPLPLTLKGKIQIEVNLGVTANVPLMLFGVGHLEARGLKLLNPGPVDAGRPLIARLENTGAGEPFMLETGEVLVKAVAMNNVLAIE